VPEAIFFGSRERGDFRPHSDLNLLLISESFAGQPLPVLLRRLHEAWHADVLLEMLPVTPEELEDMKSWNRLCQEALERGVRITVDLGPQAEGDRDE